MPPRELTIGEKIGRYTILEELPLIFTGSRNRKYYLAECECGVKKKVRSDGLLSGHVVSCGCYNREISRNQKVNITHGGCGTRLYGIWKQIRGRCNAPSNERYFDYGGRGILLCTEWKESFESFRDWSLANGYSEELSIDRINVNGNYEPGNCRWATDEMQANNKRTNILYDYKGELLTLPVIARRSGANFSTLYRRINEVGMSLEEALSVKRYAKLQTLNLK